jgi:hypothetical protein
MLKNKYTSTFFTLSWELRQLSQRQATGWTEGEEGLTSGKAKRFLSTPQRPDRLWDLPRLISNGFRGLFPGGPKRQSCEADQSLSYNAEVKNGGAVTPLHHTS